MKRVAVLYNPRSGALASGEPLDRRLVHAIERHGAMPEVRPFDPATVRADVDALLANGPRAVLVAGGDGTVTAVAEHLVGGDVPLGVVPGGTMNVLARDLGIPDDPEDAVGVLLDAPVRRIDVAEVNGRPVLCASALAMLPHLGRVRENVRGTGGVPLLRALARGVRILFRYPRTPVTLTVDGHAHHVRTRAVLVSNNPLAFGSSGSAPAGRERLDAGRLAVYATRGRMYRDLIDLTVRLVNGGPRKVRLLATYEGEVVEVDMLRPGLVSVMNDGEIVQLEPPLRYRIRSQALPVVAPTAKDA